MACFMGPRKWLGLFKGCCGRIMVNERFTRQPGRFIHQEATGLALPEIGIEAVALEQLLVGAFFHNAALVHDDQAVHGGNG